VVGSADRASNQHLRSRSLSIPVGWAALRPRIQPAYGQPRRLAVALQDPCL